MRACPRLGSAGLVHRLLIVSAFLLSLAATSLLGLSCGGDARPPAGLEKALRYFPQDAGFIATVPTDLKHEQYRRMRPLLRALTGREDIEDVLRETFTEDDFEEREGKESLVYARDIKPQLGGPFVTGDPRGGGRLPNESLFAIQARRPDRLPKLLQRMGLKRQGSHRGAELYGNELAIDGDVLLWAPGKVLRAALDRRARGKGMALSEFQRRAGTEPSSDVLLTAIGDPRGALREKDFRPLKKIKWFAALRSFSVSLGFQGGDLVGELNVRTDPGELRAGDLPLAAGSESPRIVVRDGELTGASRDQSRTTVFLAQMAREVFAKSRFIRAVDRAERELDIDFEKEVLAQFNGPSVSAVDPDGRFAARSTVADPERMRRLLPGLRPHLPRIISGLQGLRTHGLVALLLIAPDAPLTPSFGSILSAAVKVTPLADEGEKDRSEQLFRITGLREANERFRQVGPNEVVFGLIGDDFVVASNVSRAREIAAGSLRSLPGVRGASIATVDFSTMTEAVQRFLPSERPIPLGVAVGSLEASRDGVTGRVRIEIRK